MTQHFDLKFITAGKINSILPLYKNITDKLEDHILHDRFQQVLKDDYKIVAVYPQDSAIPVGLMGLSHGIRVYTGPYIEINHLVVDPEWRGNGVAKKMLAFAESYARLRDIGALSLDSYNNALSAHSLFEECDYSEIGKHFLKYI